MTPDEQRQWISKVEALRAGRIPPGIDPESSEGKRYAVLAVHVKADLDGAPSMTMAQKRHVVTLLRGGVPSGG